VLAQALAGVRGWGEHQDAPFAPRCWRGNRYLGGRRFDDRQGEVKGRACTLLPGGLHADRAAVHLDQTPADRQSQAQAAIAAGDAPLRTAEVIEDRALLLRRDAQPCVAHAHRDRLGGDVHRQANFSGSGELNGIADEVQRNL